jgi:hypothetical protein
MPCVWGNFVESINGSKQIKETFRTKSWACCPEVGRLLSLTPFLIKKKTGNDGKTLKVFR